MARGKSTVVSSLAKTESLLVVLQTGFRHQARGPNVSTKVEPANDRPSPRSELISTQIVISNHRAGLPTADDGGSRFPLNMELEPAAVARRRVHYATRLWPSS